MGFTYNKEIESILKPRLDSAVLQGFYGGKFSPDHTKFYAATLVKISDINYDDLAYIPTLLNGYSATFIDHESTNIYITPNKWQSKSIEECIDEGIFLYFSIIFMAVLLKGEWFIQKNLTFYGDQADLEQIKADIERGTSIDNCWNTGLFLPKKTLEHPFTDENQILEDPQLEEFKDLPYLVAIIKQEKKEKINHLFSNYFQEEFTLPFLQRLKLSIPNEFVDFQPLRARYTLLFPEHKKHLIICTFAKNSLNKWELAYFLFVREPNQFYKWTFFKSNLYDFPFFYGELIINDLKQVSNWTQLNYLDSSCTLDDVTFWQEYVFKKNRQDQYLYLEEILK